MCNYPNCPQKDVPTPATSEQAANYPTPGPGVETFLECQVRRTLELIKKAGRNGDTDLLISLSKKWERLCGQLKEERDSQGHTPEVLMEKVVDRVNEGGYGGLDARAPAETMPITIPTDQFLSTVKEGTENLHQGVTPETLDGVKVDYCGISFADSVLEAILSLKEHGYLVLTAEEASLEKKAHEDQLGTFQDKVNSIRAESNSKDGVIQSLASRITEAIATVGAFSALSVRAATITPESLSRILSRILLDGRSPGEQEAFVKVQLSYLPAEESALTFFSGGCMGDDE